MQKTTKVDRVKDCIVTMRNGDQWRVSSFDAFEVQGWRFSDEIVTETTGLDKGLRNTRKNKLVRADLV